jgi:uncharacterized protein (DUF1697 family)
VAVTTHVALLYSIVLTPRKRVVMADLRAMAESLGFGNVRTLVSSGNMVFETRAGDISRIEARLEAAFEKTFGRFVPIIVRTAEAWRRLASANPFPAESAVTPDQVAVRAMRTPVAAETVESLRQVATADEKVEIVDGDPWIFFSRERPNSRLLAAINHKRLGVGTARNWNTVRGLAEMISGK